MWPWIKRWRDWAMNDLLPARPARPAAAGRPLPVREGRAGAARPARPVERRRGRRRGAAAPAARRPPQGRLHPPPARPRARRRPSRSAPRPTTATASSSASPSPPATTTGELLLEATAPVAPVTVPVLTADEFLAGLRLTLPTRRASGSASRPSPRQTFVATQCRGLIASCVLRSPTPLGPARRPGADGRVPQRADRHGARRCRCR